MTIEDARKIAIPIIVCVALGLILGVRLNNNRRDKFPPVHQTLAPDTTLQTQRYNVFDGSKAFNANSTERDIVRLNKTSIFLERISISPKQTATFGGKEYVSGDKIGNFTILDIRKEEVMMEDKNSKIHYIKLGQSLDGLR